MSNNVKNVTTGKPKIGGAIFWAPCSDTLALPTDATTELAADFLGVGYASDDGVKNEISMNTDTIKAWGGDVVMVIQDGQEDTFSFKLIEVKNVNVLKAVFGEDNVKVVEASGNNPGKISISVDGEDKAECAWIIDMITRDNKAKRVVIPRSKITDIGEINYTDNEAVGYEITIMAMPDTAGKTHYEYMTV